MAAGVSAIPHERNMPGDPALKPSTDGGPEFLAASHFTIAQDPHVTKPSLKSVFKKDYPPWEILSKPEGAVPPKPAQVLQKDDRYFNEKASETRIQYEYRHLAQRETGADPDKLRATNFKMDRDMRFNSFQTTHHRDFPPKEGSPYVKETPKYCATKSYIPQGDREKADDPVSDYKDRFRGVDASLYRPVVAQNKNLGGGPTIKGDERQHDFITVHNDIYRGTSLPRIGAFPAPTGTNIPMGDPCKERTVMSVQQQSYPQHDVKGRYYDRETALKLRETSFKQKEHRLNNYTSTFTESYTPKNHLAEKFRSGKSRNHSDFPPGDEDPYRNTYAANMTTNRYYHDKKPTDIPDIVSGANKRTKSNVWFGEPTMGENYYETTTRTTFRPYQVPYTYKPNNLSNVSNLPTDFYKDNSNNTLYRDDFIDPLQSKLRPNDAAIDKLKESHIRAPLGAEREFSTEHTDQYIPKESKYVLTLPGRLQRSSVPLGTLNG